MIYERLIFVIERKSGRSKPYMALEPFRLQIRNSQPYRQAGRNVPNLANWKEIDAWRRKASKLLAPRSPGSELANLEDHAGLRRGRRGAVRIRTSPV